MSVIDEYLQNDTILPAQFFDSVRPRELSPVRKLMLATFIDGIRCLSLKPNTAPERRHLKEAKEWARSEEDGPFSFLTLCEEFEISPDYLRPRLLAGDGPSFKPCVVLGKAIDHSTPTEGYSRFPRRYRTRTFRGRTQRALK